MNSLSAWLSFRVLRIDLALFAIVVFFTPSHPLSRSGYFHMSAIICAGSKTEFSCPTA